MNNFDKEIVKFDRDNNGRTVAVKINTPLGSLNIVNVYAPNDIAERKTFFRNLDPFVIGTSPTIIGGDWNMVENLTLDKINGNPLRGNEGLTQLNCIKNAYDLIDPFRHLYSTVKAFTWSCDYTGIMTRLDRFYINKGLQKNLLDM